MGVCPGFGSIEIVFCDGVLEQTSLLFGVEIYVNVDCPLVEIQILAFFNSLCKIQQLVK